MRYTVRSAEGALSFPSRKELLNAYKVGLVDEQDEVQEEGSTAWRQADAVLGPRPIEKRESRMVARGRVLVMILGATLSLWLLLSGDLGRMAIGAAIAVGMVMSMFSLTQRASQLRRRP